MKIAVLTDRLYAGGSSECIRLIAKYLPQHTFSVFARGGAYPALEHLSNVEIMDERPSPGFLRVMEYDLVHCHNFHVLPDAVKQTFLPVVNTIHGMSSRRFDYMSGFMNDIRRMLRTSAEKILFSKASANVVQSADDKIRLLESYSLDNCVVIPNGVEPPPDDERSGMSPAEKTALKKILALPDGKKIIMMLARFEFPKGYDIFIDAVSIASDKLRKNNCCAALVGAGPLMSAMRDRVEKRGIQDIVHFCGERENARRFLHTADALVIPSRWEGMPLIALEAGMRSIPVAASDAPGLSTLLDDRRTGLVFKACSPESLAALIEEEAFFTDISATAAAWHGEVLAKYTAEKMASSLDRLYSSLC